MSHAVLFIAAFYVGFFLGLCVARLAYPEET